MAKITSLPAEVIKIIFGNSDIEDVMNFTSTCTRFQHILSDYDKFWEKKYYERCSTARRKYNIKEKSKKFEKVDFEKKIKTSMNCVKQLQHYVSLISNNNLTLNNKIQLKRLLRSTAEDKMIYYFVLDELSRIISAQLQKHNLTNKYYFGLISHNLKQYRFTYKVIKFLSMPKEKQLLEQLLTFVAEYFEPHISYSVLRTWFDDIAEKIRQRIKNKYSTHAISSMTSNEKFSFWRDNNIYYNFWNPTEVEQIMGILEEFIFSELEVDQLLNVLDLKNEYINCILDILRKYLLIVTFHSVARRLGIHCALWSVRVQHECSVLIVWNPNYNADSAEDFKYTETLFVKKKSDLLYPLNIVKTRGNYNPEFTAINYTWITQFIMSNFYNELKDKNIHCKWKFSLIHCIPHPNIEINTSIETEIYRYITKPIQIKCNKRRRPRRRSEKIKFAVGMIVTHSSNHHNPFYVERDNHDGVIIGWHILYSKFKNDTMFPYLRDCDGHYYYHICEESLDNSNQPHYIILTESNRVCYIQQDNILPCSPREINNIELGRFFSKFEGTHYVPNKRLAKEYPMDTDILLQQFSNQ